MSTEHSISSGNRILRSELEAVALELAAEKLAYALRRCCEDNYSDPESAMRGYIEEAARVEFSHVCPNCGASFSLPLGMTCEDHRPVLVAVPS